MWSTTYRVHDKHKNNMNRKQHICHKARDIESVTIYPNDYPYVDWPHWKCVIHCCQISHHFLWLTKIRYHLDLCHSSSIMLIIIEPGAVYMD